MNEDLQRLHDMLVAAFMALSPALFVAVFAILLGLLLGALRQALRNLRIVQAVAKAPLVDLRSTVAGLVKIRGTAQPPELHSRAGRRRRPSGTRATAAAAATRARSAPPTTS